MESEVLYNVVEKPNSRKMTRVEEGETQKEGEEDRLNERGNQKSLLNLKKPKALYIYDFVKVKVTLNEHFYVLSRHMISRMLMLCRVFLQPFIPDQENPRPKHSKRTKERVSRVKPSRSATRRDRINGVPLHGEI